MELKGIYAQIDTKLSVQAIETLRNGEREEKATMAKTVEENSDRYCPAVFFSLADYLFESGKTDDALFWLYAGRIRTQYDIKRSTDESVLSGYTILNNSVPILLRLIQFENIENTKKIVEKAVRWDKETAANYDPRWIALHGIRAFTDPTSETSLTIPEEEWNDLSEKNRKEYIETFMEDLNNITLDQLNEIKVKISQLKAENHDNQES